MYVCRTCPKLLACSLAGVFKNGSYLESQHDDHDHVDCHYDDDHEGVVQKKNDDYYYDGDKVSEDNAQVISHSVSGTESRMQSCAASQG